MKPTHLPRALAAVLLLASSCAQAQQQPVPTQAETVRDVHAAMAAAKLDLLLLLQDPAFRIELLQQLITAPKQRIAISNALQFSDQQANERIIDSVHALDAKVRELKGLKPDGAPLLQVRLALPAGLSAQSVTSSNLYVVATPVADDHQWLDVLAHNADGGAMIVDPVADVQVPMLVVGISADIALREGLEMINEGLRSNNLQTLPTAGRAEPLAVSVLQRARLLVDHEPNIKGRAEIFAIVSGLNADEAKPELRTVTMPWLEYDKTTYYPNQDLVIWNGFRYGVANVQMFEEDGQTNYKEMLLALIKGVGAVLGPIHPSIPVVAEVGSAILKVLPDSAFTDDHDYVDSYYLLERGRAYNNHWGAVHNANVDIVPKMIGN